MQMNCTTGEVYAAQAHRDTRGATIELMTFAPHSYSVTCSQEGDDDFHWVKDFGSNLAAAVAEFNRWVKEPERVPTFN